MSSPRFSKLQPQMSQSSASDLKTESLASAWPKVGAAWRSPEVQDFVRRAQTETDLLKHANECWDLAV